MVRKESYSATIVIAPNRGGERWNFSFDDIKFNQGTWRAEDVKHFLPTTNELEDEEEEEEEEKEEEEEEDDEEKEKEQEEMDAFDDKMERMYETPSMAFITSSYRDEACTGTLIT